MSADTGSGYIRLHRQILKWEWWSNPNTFRLFIYLLLKANYNDQKFEGQVIRRGQLVTSIPRLSQDTALTPRQVRVALDHLKLTGEVTDCHNFKYRIITISKYDEYQTNDRLNGSLMTDKRQTDDRLMTASKEINKDNKEKNNIKPLKRFVPPTLEEIEEYCHERQNHVSPYRFFDYYESVGWCVGKTGRQMKDWKAAVRTWERSEQTERDYRNDQSMAGLPV